MSSLKDIMIWMVSIFIGWSIIEFILVFLFFRFNKIFRNKTHSLAHKKVSIFVFIVLSVLFACGFMLSTKSFITKEAMDFYTLPAKNDILIDIFNEMGYEYNDNTRSGILKQITNPPSIDEAQKNTEEYFFIRFRQIFFDDNLNKKLLTTDKEINIIFETITKDINAHTNAQSLIYKLAEIESIDDENAYVPLYLKNQIRSYIRLETDINPDMILNYHYFFDKETKLENDEISEKDLAMMGFMADVAHKVEEKYQSDKEFGVVYKKIVSAFFQRILQNMQPFYRSMTLIWGPIQFITVIFYFFGLSLLAARYALLKSEKNTIAGELDELGESRLDYWKGKKSQSVIINNFIKINEKSQIKENIHNMMENFVRSCIEYIERVEYASLNYVIWGIPSLGFIGTVLGIGQALSNADQVVKAIDTQAQVNAIQAVTSTLGVAFDTTLIALVCNIPLMALLYTISAQESAFLNDFKERIVKKWDVDHARER